MTSISMQQSSSRSAFAGCAESRVAHPGFGLDTLRQWRRRLRERANLAALDDRTLRDVGLNRIDVAYEVGKPFWRA